ncbi:MAG: hypothetical protein WDZ94_01360 [Patescibacteria group bacterium]
MSNNEMNYAYQEVRKLHSRAPLLWQADQLINVKLLNYMITEIFEVEDALNQDLTTKEVSGEIRDVIVFCLAFHRWLVGDTKPSDTMRYVNGFGKESAAFEKVREQAVEIQESPNLVAVNSIFPELLGRVYSIAFHSPEGIKVFLDFADTVNKVLSNYPPEVFSGVDPDTGRPINSANVLLMFDHASKAMRLIRKNYPGDFVLPEHWQPFLKHILDFRNSEVALGLIKVGLEQRARHETDSGIQIASIKDVQAIEAGEPVVIYDRKQPMSQRNTGLRPM